LILRATSPVYHNGSSPNVTPAPNGENGIRLAGIHRFGVQRGQRGRMLTHSIPAEF
jgi:hypothetical protein